MTYPGGKGLLYRHLINLMPAHSTFIEPFLGMGAVIRNKRPAARNIGVEIDSRVLDQWQGDEIPGLELVCGDALDFLREFPFDGRELVYADPPYVPSTRRARRVYRHDYSVDDHQSLLEVLVQLPCRVMLSGYENQLYSTRLSKWTALSFDTGSHGLARTETVWLNFDPPSVPFDLRWAGANFRERQRIKRKQSRLRQKISDLPEVERRLLVDWLDEEYGSQPGRPTLLNTSQAVV
jgi:DNA adenine methylase